MRTTPPIPKPPIRTADEILAAAQCLDADALRSLLLDTLVRYDMSRGQLEDTLMQDAVANGFRPPLRETAVPELTAFLARSRRIGFADPAEVDAHMRRGVDASMGGNHEQARALLEPLFEALAEGDFDMGQLDAAPGTTQDVLNVQLPECALHCAAAIYLTTSIRGRAFAVLRFVDRVCQVVGLGDALEGMSWALGRELPDVAAFLPDWIAWLDRSGSRPEFAEWEPDEQRWESDEQRWFRHAIARRDGVAGLARVARESGQYRASVEWCDVIKSQGDWAQTRDAYQEAAKFEGELRGTLLDGAALASLRMGTGVLEALDAAYREDPSLIRLVRWLGFDADGRTIVTRAAEALGRCRPNNYREVALLQLLTGDVASVAATAEKADAPTDHGLQFPDGGLLLFAFLVWALDPPASAIASRLLLAPVIEPISFAVAWFAEGERTREYERDWGIPTIWDLLGKVEIRLAPEDRVAAVRALRTAAETRVAAATKSGTGRRQRELAVLVAACVELGDDGPRWGKSIVARARHVPRLQRAIASGLAKQFEIHALDAWCSDTDSRPTARQIH